MTSSLLLSPSEAAKCRHIQHDSLKRAVQSATFDETLDAHVKQTGVGEYSHAATPVADGHKARIEKLCSIVDALDDDEWRLE